MTAANESRLFAEEAPRYDGAKFPTPRPFQESAHQSLRQGFLEGHRRQLIAAPTGAGKSILALRIIHEALLRGKRAVFLADRTTLINQTSAAAVAVGLYEHGIVQANHPRRDASLPFQIASTQTIAKRGFWPQLDVLVVDEAHTMHAAWVEYALKTQAVVIGLSATPFTRGLGQVFHEGIESLDMGEKLDRTPRQEPEDYEAKGCPSCGHSPFRKRCMSCGYEKPAPVQENAEAGQMVEIAIGKGKNRKVLANNPAHLWAQLCSYARAHSAPDKQHWRARFLFRDIMGHLPPEDWHISTTPDEPVSQATANKIKGLNIRRNVYRRAA